MTQKPGGTPIYRRAGMIVGNFKKYEGGRGNIRFLYQLKMNKFLIFKHF